MLEWVSIEFTNKLQQWIKELKDKRNELLTSLEREKIQSLENDYNKYMKLAKKE